MDMERVDSVQETEKVEGMMSNMGGREERRCILKKISRRVHGPSEAEDRKF